LESDAAPLPEDFDLEASIRPTWSLGQIVLAVVGAVVLQALLLVVVLPVSSAYGSESAEVAAVSFALTPLWYALIVYIAYALAGRDGAALRRLGLRPASREFERAIAGLRGRVASLTGFRVSGWVLVAIAGFAVAQVTLQVYGLVVDALDVDALKPSGQIPEVVFERDWLVALMGFTVVVAAPFAEEVFVRGFMFGGLARLWGFWPAALVSAALFALAHGDVGLLMPFALIGVVLAAAYQRTGTLLAPMTIHYAFNLLSYLILVFVPEARP
jgi:membrane protease YdiL (CAAX protease family)